MSEMDDVRKAVAQAAARAEDIADMRLLIRADALLGRLDDIVRWASSQETCGETGCATIATCDLKQTIVPREVRHRARSSAEAAAWVATLPGRRDVHSSEPGRLRVSLVPEARGRADVRSKGVHRRQKEAVKIYRRIDCKHRWRPFTKYKAECSTCGHHRPWKDIVTELRVGARVAMKTIMGQARMMNTMRSKMAKAAALFTIKHDS